MAKISRVEPKTQAHARRQRVAAYARVSKDMERLMHSVSAQVSYYSKLIQGNPEWEYAGVYADITEQKRIQCKFRPSHNSISHIRSENMSQRYKNNTILYYT